MMQTQALETENSEELETGGLGPSRRHLTTHRSEGPGRWGQFKAWCGVVWRRAKAEFWVELPLLRQRWLVTLLCLCFQYVHAVFTTLAYHLHEPLPEPLHDIGFEIFPPLGQDNSEVTEAMVYTGFGLFAAWLLSPFITRAKTFHSAVVFKRVLVILVTCQTLRIISFLSTQIPAPNYHCLAGQPTATLPWPDHWWQNIIVNVSRQASTSCGDLIFSSHTTFLLVFMWTYAVLGKYMVIKVLSFMYVAATSCLIIASRKHYTVDITVAWYVVPAFFFHFRRHWTTVRDDVASPDGSAILPENTLPTTAGAGGAEGAPAKDPAARGLDLLLRKLHLRGTAPTAGGPPPAPVAERSASAHLLAGARESEAGEVTGAAGSQRPDGRGQGHSPQGPGRPGSPSWEGVDLRAVGSAGELNPLYSPERRQGGQASAASSQEAEAPPAPVGPDSPVKRAMQALQGLPQRMASLRGTGSASQHRRGESGDSSTVALRAGAGASSSAADELV